MPAEASQEVYWYVYDNASSAFALPSSQMTVNRTQEVRRRGVRAPGSVTSFVLSDGIKEPFRVSARWLQVSDSNLDAWSDSDALDAAVTTAKRFVKVANTETILDSSGSAITDAAGATLYGSAGHSIELHGLLSFIPTESVDHSELHTFYSAEWLSIFGAPLEGAAKTAWAYESYESTA